MTNTTKPESDPGKRDSEVMGLTPVQIAARLIGAALLLIVLMIAISVASNVL